MSQTKNISVFDFIHPSAAKPNMVGNKAKNTQVKPNQQAIDAKSREERKRNSKDMGTDDETENSQGSPKTKKNKTCDCDGWKEAFAVISAKLSKLDKLDNIETSIAQLSTDLLRNDNKIIDIQQDVETINNDITEIRNQLDDFRSDKIKIEIEVRRLNLILSGIKEEDNENEHKLASKIQKVVTDIKPGTQFKYDTISRLGAPTSGKTRNVIVRFETMKQRNTFFELRKETTPPVFINMDVPEAVRKAEYLLRVKIRQLKTEKIPIQSVNWRKYEIETVSKLFRLETNGSFLEIAKHSSDEDDMSFLEH